MFSSRICHIIHTTLVLPIVRQCEAERELSDHVLAVRKQQHFVYFSVLNSISLALQSVFLFCLSVLMHSTAGYRSWFSPTMRNAHCTWVGLRSDHVHNTNELRQSSFVSSPRPPVVLIRIQVSIAVFTPDQTNCTNEESTPESILTRLNSSGVKMP